MDKVGLYWYLLVPIEEPKRNFPDWQKKFEYTFSAPAPAQKKFFLIKKYIGKYLQDWKH